MISLKNGLGDANLYEGEKSIQHLTEQNFNESLSHKNIVVIVFNKPDNAACKAFAPEYIKASIAYEVFNLKKIKIHRYSRMPILIVEAPKIK